MACSTELTPSTPVPRASLDRRQALVRQLQAEQAGFKQELANQAGVVEQQVQSLDQQVRTSG